MGFWSSLWGGIKSFASGCASVVKAIATPVVKIVTKTVEVVSKVVTPIVEGATKVVDFITKPIQKVASFIGQKLNQAKNWFLQQTSLGQSIYRGYRYFMDQTFIGKGIKWCGQKLSQAKEWYDNTAFGKFTNKFMPLIDLTGMALGGVPGLILNGISKVSNIANTIQNPLSLIPGYNTVKDYVTNNRFTQFIGDKLNGFKTTFDNISEKTQNYLLNSKAADFLRSGYQKANHLKSRFFESDSYKKVSSFIQDKKEKLSTKFNQNVLGNEYVQKGLTHLGKFKNTAFEYGKQYMPHAYSHTKTLLNTSKNLLNKFSGSASQIYSNNIKNTTFGKKFDKGLNFFNKYTYRPSKFIGSKLYTNIGKPVGSYLWQKFQGTNFYNKYFKNTIEGFKYVQKQAKHIQAKNIVSKSQFGQKLKTENRQNGMDSSNFLGSYLNKYGGESESLQKIRQKFINVADYPRVNLSDSSINENFLGSRGCNAEQKYWTLNSLVDSGKVKIQSLIFNAGQSNKSYSIEGKLTIENKTNEKINFEILSGQIFGCSIAKTSQHTVARGLKGFLDPLQKKVVTLESFCGDSSLKWPYGDSNYTMTNYLLKDFKDDINQDSVWSLTNR